MLDTLGTYTTRQHQLAEATTVCELLQYLRKLDGHDLQGVRLFLEQQPRHMHADIIRQHLALGKKAAGVGTVGGGSWASLLPGSLVSSFVGLVHNQSLLGRIPGLRKVPAGIGVPVVAAPGVFTWVGEGTSKPLTELDFEQVTVKLCKCLGLVVVSEELLRTAGPGTAALLRDSLVAGLARFLDQQFTDPTVAGGTTSPASITNGVTAVPSTGVLDVDVFALVAKFFEDRPLAERPTLLLPPAVSAALGVVDHAGDMRVRPMTLGQLPGLDTVVSANLGRLVVMLDAAAIAWTGADTIEFSYSRQASVEVSDTPTSPPIATTVLRNLWQENLAGLRTEQYVGWARSQVSAVQYLDTTPAAP